MLNTADFRQCATDCLSLSERSRVPRHKALFLRMAQSWLALAEAAHNPACHADAEKAPRRQAKARAGGD